MMTHGIEAELDAHRVLLVKLASHIIQESAVACSNAPGARKTVEHYHSALLESLLAACERMIDRSSAIPPNRAEDVKHRVATLLDAVALAR